MSVECSRCQPATYLHNGLCYRDCPEGFSAVAGVCQPCLHTCQDCRSQESCSSCRPGLLMNNGTCVAACPQSTYRSLDDCLPCAPTCLTCFGPRPDECVSCHASWLLVAGSCHTSCPSGYFQTPAGCRRCHRTCRTCTGIELTSCSSCHEGYQLLSGANTCVPCGGREYFEPRAKVCRPCYETCGTCQGPGPRNCTSCAGELRLQLPQHRCLRCCDQQRPRTATPASCCPCDPSREHCVRGTRRRTADSYFLAPEPATSSFNWFYVQGAVWCVASLLLFGVVFTVLQCRVLSGRRHTPVLELADGDEHLALTDYQNEDHMDELSDTDEDHLVVFDSRT
ncbi:furin-like protease 2 [Pollicipes pollicipes]|uniref:furin-like protease 2 n=1 Tax=Pollicipes pollicipes TaxID=41117 RepID=UPI0018855747|nr:furin-like protease 2 [Pollicipes pollicipes]